MSLGGEIMEDYYENNVIPPLKERIRTLENDSARMLRELYEEIKHGDEEHQQWLKNKIETFIKQRNL